MVTAASVLASDVSVLLDLGPLSPPLTTVVLSGQVSRRLMLTGSGYRKWIELTPFSVLKKLQKQVLQTAGLYFIRVYSMII